MVKKYTFTLLLLFIVFCSFAQTIGTYKFNDKRYYVYPYRISSDDIPAMGFKIPDGEYVVFDNYSFKKKFSFHRDRRKFKYKLADTTVVNAVITIKNNLAEGAAIFYDYPYKRNRTIKKTPQKITTGNLINGLKDGQWRSEWVKYKNYEIENYTNGIKTGYSLRYYSNNKLSKKEKYCDGKLCDTVTEYFGGRVFEEYDVLEKFSYPTAPTIYEKALSDYGDPNKDAKTFYKKYDYSGNLIMNLRYVDGVLQPFDSLGDKYVSKDGKYDQLEYITVKNTGTNEQVVTHYNKDYSRTYVTYNYYKNGFNYALKSRKINIERKKKMFSKKYIIINQDTTNITSIHIDLKDIDQKSTQPIAIETYIMNGDTTFSYYIPKYKFDFRGDPDFKFLYVDTLAGSIYFDRINQNWKKNTIKTDKMLYMALDSYRAQNIKQNPFYLKNYIVINSVDKSNMNERYNYNNVRSGISEDDFTSKTIISNYKLNDTLMSGNYFFSVSKRKGKGWPKDKRLVYAASYDEEGSGGNFKNGKKDGTWIKVDWREPRKIPNDVSAYFFAHPAKAEYLIKEEYKDGLRNGAYVRHDVVSEEEDGEYVHYYNEDGSQEKKPGNKDAVIKKNTIFKSCETEFKNDTLDGIYKEYYANGNLSTEAKFSKGKPTGDFKEYNSDGKLYSLIQFDNGLLNGKYTRYDNDKLSCYAFFKNNILTDSLIYFHTNGKPMTGIYTENEKMKCKKLFFYNGQLKEEINFSPFSKYMLSKETISSESFVTDLTSFKDSTLYKANGDFKNYYENGQKLAEGSITKGKLSDHWKFYSITGQLLHNVRFRDSMIVFKGSTDSVDIHGFYTGYYSNGNKRCTGYLKSVALNYDCFTKQDKVDPDFYVVDFFDINGKQTVSNGSGYFIKYDPDGLRMSAGKLINFQMDSLWRYYTPEQKLDGIGHYVNDEKDGVWYSGDLEGINFEDGACFDMNNPAEVKEYELKRKDLNITRSIYRNGLKVGFTNFRSNLSKTFKPRRGHNNSF